jgi:hypothetical protein
MPLTGSLAFRTCPLLAAYDEVPFLDSVFRLLQSGLGFQKHLASLLELTLHKPTKEVIETIGPLRKHWE